MLGKIPGTLFAPKEFLGGSEVGGKIRCKLIGIAFQATG